MTGSDPQKLFLTLIRGFATENSQGECDRMIRFLIMILRLAKRRVVDLRKQINELRSETIAANAELEDAKRLKETTEQELRGHEVELAMTEALIQTLEARISSIQDEVSALGSDLEALKNEGGSLRDDFFDKMYEMSAKIRNFQRTVVNAFHGENCTQTSKNEDAEVSRRAFENKLKQMISQTKIKEKEYQAEQIVHKQVQQELIELEEKVSLMEALLKENKELQDLTRQISEFETSCASLGNELQKRCLCPSCNLDNAEALGGILQASGGCLLFELKLKLNVQGEYFNTLLWKR